MRWFHLDRGKKEENLGWNFYLRKEFVWDLDGLPKMPQR